MHSIWARVEGMCRLPAGLEKQASSQSLGEKGPALPWDVEDKSPHAGNISSHTSVVHLTSLYWALRTLTSCSPITHTPGAEAELPGTGLLVSSELKKLIIYSSPLPPKFATLVM